jgi:hypothetical protein
LDIGANVGWFSIHLGLRGVDTIALETHPRSVRIMKYALRKLNLENVYPLNMRITPATVDLVPPADMVLFLAVWHHLAKAHGLDAATDMLRQIWSQTRKVMFFETGEAHATRDFGLPAFDPDPKTWITKYLTEECDQGVVVHLGSVPAPQPSSDGTRNLFAIVRQ